MTAVEEANVDVAQRYLAAIESGANGSMLAEFLHPDIVYEELPNRVVPNGARATLAQMQAAAERGARLMASQRFRIDHVVASGAFVVLEVDWSGTLGMRYTTLEPGSAMHARVAMVLEFRDGRIIAQRNYDCYDPW